MEKVELFPRQEMNEFSPNPFGILFLFQQSQRPKHAAPSVDHLGIKPSLSVCFHEDSHQRKRIAISEVA